MGSAASILALLRSVLGFTNLSAAASYAQAAQGIGDFIDTILQEMTNSQNTILNIISTQRYGKPVYYTSIALAFQDGDDLVPATGTLDPSYAVIDPTKQVVKAAAFQNSAGSLSIKVAGQNGITGQLQALTAQQLSDFTAYFLNFEIPGLPVTEVSLPPNIFAYTVVVTFNSGYNQSNIQAAVAAAEAAFNTTFQFNGTLRPDLLSQYIVNNVPGMIDYYITGTLIDGVAFAGSTTLLAGYFNYAPNNTHTWNAATQ